MSRDSGVPQSRRSVGTGRRHRPIQRTSALPPSVFRSTRCSRSSNPTAAPPPHKTAAGDHDAANLELHATGQVQVLPFGSATRSTERVGRREHSVRLPAGCAPAFYDALQPAESAGHVRQPCRLVRERLVDGADVGAEQRVDANDGSRGNPRLDPFRHAAIVNDLKSTAGWRSTSGAPCLAPGTTWSARPVRGRAHR